MPQVKRKAKKSSTNGRSPKKAAKESSEERESQVADFAENGVHEENGVEENGAEVEETVEEYVDDPNRKKEVINILGEAGTLVVCGDMNFALGEYKKGKGFNKDIAYVRLSEDVVYSPHKVSSFAGIQVSHVAAGNAASHCIVITNTGATWAWGKNVTGQLGQGDSAKYSQPQLVKGLDNVVATKASCGNRHTLLLTDEGRVYSWGKNNMGQCGVGNQELVLNTPKRVAHGKLKIVDVACGTEFSMIVDNKGDLYSFGKPEYGQTGHGTDGQYFITASKLAHECITKPKLIQSYVQIIKNHRTPVASVHIQKVVCGPHHTVAIDAMKRVFTWGFGGYGRLGHESSRDEQTPRLLMDYYTGGPWLADRVECGRTWCIGTSVGTKDHGTMYLWGQLNVTSNECTTYPKALPNYHCTNTSVFTSGMNHNVCCTEESVLTWGVPPHFGELGLGEHCKTSSKPMEVRRLEGAHILSASAGSHHTLFVVRDTTPGDTKILDKCKEYRVR